MGTPIWVKSSFSFSNGNCIELAEMPGGNTIGVRDSKRPDDMPLMFTRQEMRAFFDAILTGQFERFT